MPCAVCIDEVVERGVSVPDEKCDFLVYGDGGLVDLFVKYRFVSVDVREDFVL